LIPNKFKYPQKNENYYLRKGNNQQQPKRCKLIADSFEPPTQTSQTRKSRFDRGLEGLKPKTFDDALEPGSLRQSLLD